ncbi:MAG: hypothetical protein V3T48_13165 [Vicinamibacterales bacterium]
MAHLWVRHAAAEAEEEWAVVPLVTDAFTLVLDAPYVAPRLPDAGEVGLMSAAPEYGAGEGEAQWVLLIADVAVARVNGTAVVGGIRALHDRDEIRGPRLGRYFFSTELLASVVPSPGSERTLFCPRCKLPIEPATSAVRCPVCAIWHHQNDTHSCWDYAEECAVCRHDTALDRGYRWSPDEL